MKRYLNTFYAPLIAYVLVVAFGMFLDSQGRHGQDFVDFMHIFIIGWLVLVALDRIENAVARKTVALLKQEGLTVRPDPVSVAMARTRGGLGPDHKLEC